MVWTLEHPTRNIQHNTAVKLFLGDMTGLPIQKLRGCKLRGCKLRGWKLRGWKLRGGQSWTDVKSEIVHSQNLDL